jgi:N-methylhydantoinase A
MRVLLGRLNEVPEQLLDGQFADLERQATELLGREGFTADRIMLTRALDLRYLGQQWDVTVAITDGFDQQRIRATFERDYERLFGHIQPDGAIEITKIRLGAKGLIPPLPQSRAESMGRDAAPIETRQVWLDPQLGWWDTPVFDGSTLRVGQTIHGPAIINEPTTTVMIGPDDDLTVDPGGNYKIVLGA